MRKNNSSSDVMCIIVCKLYFYSEANTFIFTIVASFLTDVYKRGMSFNRLNTSVTGDAFDLSAFIIYLALIVLTYLSKVKISQYNEIMLKILIIK